MEYRNKKFPFSGIPLGAIVTVSGTGAEMNGGAVITREAQHWKGPILGSAPTFAILDPIYTLSVPKMQVISGAFNTLSHAMETYFGTSDKDNVSDDLALAVMRNTVQNMQRILADSYDIQARGNLMWDSAMAENGILKCGRSTDFQVHQIEHQLGAYTNCNHGQGLAVIQPIYLRHIADAASEKCKRFAQVVFHADTAEDGITAFAQFVRQCGLPVKLRELASDVPVTPELLWEVAKSCNLISTNPRPLNAKEIYEILTECA